MFKFIISLTDIIYFERKKPNTITQINHQCNSVAGTGVSTLLGLWVWVGANKCPKARKIDRILLHFPVALQFQFFLSNYNLSNLLNSNRCRHIRLSG